MKKGLIVVLTAIVFLFGLLLCLRDWRRANEPALGAQEAVLGVEQEDDMEAAVNQGNISENSSEADTSLDEEVTNVESIHTENMEEGSTENENVEVGTENPAGDVESSEEDTALEHKHSYSTSKVDPTCTSKGYTVYSCACGFSYTEDDSPKLGHNYMMEYVPSQTEGEDLFIYTCTTCGYSYEEIPGKSDEFPDVSVNPESPEDEKEDENKKPSVGTPETEDYGFCPYCGRRIWTSWYPEGCFTFLVDSVCDCGVLVKAGECHYHKAEQQEEETCLHEWKMKYYPEKGHYSESFCVCKCGWRFEDPKEWIEHVKANLSEAVDKHTSWTTGKDYIIESPERREWICQKCGEVSETEP